MVSSSRYRLFCPTGKKEVVIGVASFQNLYTDTFALSLLKVQQGRTGNEKDMSSVLVHTSKPDFPSPVSLYKPAPPQVTRYHLLPVVTYKLPVF